MKSTNTVKMVRDKYWILVKHNADWAIPLIFIDERHARSEEARFHVGRDYLGAERIKTYVLPATLSYSLPKPKRSAAKRPKPNY